MKRGLFIYAAGLCTQFAVQWAAGRYGDELHRRALARFVPITEGKLHA